MTKTIKADRVTLRRQILGQAVRSTRLISDVALMEMMEKRLHLSASPSLYSGVLPPLGGDMLYTLRTEDDFQATVHNSGDYYGSGAGKTNLLRVVGETAVGFADGSNLDAVVSSLTKAGGALRGYGRGATLGRRGVLLKASDTVRKSMKSADGENARTAAGKVKGVAWTSPVFVDPKSGLRLVAGDQIIVALKPGTRISNIVRSDVVSYEPAPGTPDQFILNIKGGGDAALTAAKAYAARPGVAWSEPDFFAESKEQTNDTYFNKQWYLGASTFVPPTGGLPVSADSGINAPAAWTKTTGKRNIVIAVMDAGIDKNHSDLDIWENPGELSGASSVDDDRNGWVDDIHGYDFLNNDAEPLVADPPDPGAETSDWHATSVAGIAAAKGNNTAGVAGVAYGSKIMSLRVNDDNGGNWADNASLASAIYYAAGRTRDGSGTWAGADVLNMSIGFSPSAAVTEALKWAAANGRNGLGLPIFVAAGNDATAYSYWPEDYSVTVPANSSITFKWEYTKDGSGDAGEDSAWLVPLPLHDFRMQLGR